MNGVLFAKSAILLDFHSVGSVLFIFLLVVIALFTLRASKRDFDSASGCRHKTFYLRKKLHPQRCLYTITHNNLVVKGFSALFSYFFSFFLNLYTRITRDRVRRARLACLRRAVRKRKNIIYAACFPVRSGRSAKFGKAKRFKFIRK